MLKRPVARSFTSMFTTILSGVAPGAVVAFTSSKYPRLKSRWRLRTSFWNVNSSPSATRSSRRRTFSELLTLPVMLIRSTYTGPPSTIGMVTSTFRLARSLTVLGSTSARARPSSE